MITIIFVALVGLAISGGTFLAYQLMLNFHPGPAKVRKEVEKLMSTFDNISSEFVPLNQKELELISHSHTQNEVRKGITTTAKGVIISIYEEPMIAYTYKRYTGKKENAALLVRTANQELFFRIRNQQAKVSLNNQAVGIIERNGILYSPGDFRPLAKIEKKDRRETFPIMVEGKEVASLVAYDPTLRVHQRALQFVGDLDKRQELFLLLMLSWELVREKELGE
ncbi:MAG: hypothetical protein AB8F74_18845 [Saprospiraceae bacterium]